MKVLLNSMVRLSNNSKLTHKTAKMLAEKLDENELKELQTWLTFTNNKVASDLSMAKRRKYYR